MLAGYSPLFFRKIVKIERLALHDDTKNGCVADYVTCGYVCLKCSESSLEMSFKSTSGAGAGLGGFSR